MTATRFATSLAFLMGAIFVWYVALMTVFAVIEGGITAEQYPDGARPTIEQTLEDERVYLPRIN